MINIDVQTQESFGRIHTILQGIPGGVEKATRGVISRATTTARATTIKGITSVYSIQAGSVRGKDNTNVQTKTLTMDGGIAGVILFSGTKIPLVKFGVSHKTPKPGQLVKARIRQDTPPAAFDNAFVANMGHGMGVFERLSQKRKPTTQIMGVATAQMASDSDVLNKVETEAINETIVKRTEHEITRILNGYGG